MFPPDVRPTQRRAPAGDGVVERIRSLRCSLADELDRLDVDALDPLDAQELVPELAGIERQAAAAATVCGARAAESTSRQEGGARAAVEWLANHVGRSRQHGERALHLAHTTREVPAVRAAWLAGRLTFDQAELVADAARCAPEREQELVDLARRVPLEELRTTCRRVIRDARSETDEERHHRHHTKRRLSTWTDDDGAFTGRFSTTALQGAGIKAVLDLCTEAVYRRARRLDRHASLTAHRLDALELMAQLAAGAHPARLGYELDDLPAALRPSPDADHDDTWGHDDQADGCDDSDEVDDGVDDEGDDEDDDGHGTTSEPPGHASNDDDRGPFTGPTGSRPGERPAGKRRQKKRYRARGPGAGAVIAVADLAALRRGHRLPGEHCEIPGIGPIPVAAAIDLLGEAALRIVLTDGVDVHTVAHPRRRPTAHQQTAILARYHECAVSGCTSRIALQNDHDDPWADTHHTWLPGLKRICPHHHARKTNHGWDWVVEPPDPLTGKHRLVPPQHPDHPATTRTPKPRPPDRHATAA